VKAGVSLAEIDLELVNEVEKRNGLSITRREAPVSEQRAKMEAWREVIRGAAENRTVENTQGSIVSRIGTYTGLGFFVPTEFLTETYAAMAAHDSLLSPEAVTVLESTNGRVTEVPTLGDIENVAAVMGEAASSTASEAAIHSPGHAS